MIPRLGSFNVGGTKMKMDKALYDALVDCSKHPDPAKIVEMNKKHYNALKFCPGMGAQLVFRGDWASGTASSASRESSREFTCLGGPRRRFRAVSVRPQKNDTRGSGDDSLHYRVSGGIAERR